VRVHKPGSATRPPRSIFSAPRAFRSSSTSARVPTAASNPSRTKQRPISLSQVGKGIAPPRTMSAQRQQLRCTSDEQGIRQAHFIAQTQTGRTGFSLSRRITLFHPSALSPLLGARCCPLYAGKNTSRANVSYDVGVVVFPGPLLQRLHVPRLMAFAIVHDLLREVFRHTHDVIACKPGHPAAVHS